MTSLKRCAFLLFTLTLGICSAPAQSNKQPAISKVFATLTNTVDTKKSVKGDEVLMTTLGDVAVDGKIIIPKGSKLVGSIAGVISKGKDEPKSVLAISIDKAIVNATEIPLQAIIAAMAAPAKPLSDDPTYTMLHSNEPKMVGSATSGVTSSGTLPASSKATSTAAVATAQLKGAQDQPFLLTEDSQGALGYEGVAVSWHLTIPPPLTIFATNAKNLKLLPGTQMLLRMVPPKPANQ